jgi:hypothetical protein
MPDGPGRTKLRIRTPSTTAKPKPRPEREPSPAGGGPKDSVLVAVRPAAGCEHSTGAASQKAQTRQTVVGTVRGALDAARHGRAGGGR